MVHTPDSNSTSSFIIPIPIPIPISIGPAARARAREIDRDAISSARRNAAMNGVGDAFDFYLPAEARALPRYRHESSPRTTSFPRERPRRRP